MLEVYKKNTLPKNIELIKKNDIFFNKYTSMILDDKAKDIIKGIDKSEMIDQYSIKSRFDGLALNIDKLSTGCKTALNIFYNKDKIFDICECGENALDIIYDFEDGKIYCEYPLISFDIKKVKVIEKKNAKIFDSYEELKKWWLDEN